MKLEAIRTNVAVSEALVRGETEMISQQWRNNLKEYLKLIPLSTEQLSTIKQQLADLSEIDGIIYSTSLDISAVQELNLVTAINYQQLQQFKKRDLFFKRVFTSARFREVKAVQAIGSLVKFHSLNKFLLMSFSEVQMRKLGRLTANSKQRPPAEVITDYEATLAETLTNEPTVEEHINVLMHLFGFISDELSTTEKEEFLRRLEEYRAGKLTWKTINDILQTLVEQYGAEYVKQQTIFTPYPPQLVESINS
ncbi:MAG: YbgA family protein [Bacillota bacterium]